MLRPNASLKHFSRLNALTVLITAVFTLLMALSLWWNIYNALQISKELAKKEARATFNKDQAFRIWATKHGGVYVPETEETPSNPYLSHIPERDIQLPSGKKLTLMNPAYMMRQMMTEYAELYGVKGRITSLKVLNPKNVPDEWEKKALKSFESGTKEVSEFVEVNGEPYLRLMQPMIAQKGCLKCHGHQGYTEGNVRGGVGVSVPMTPYLTLEKRSIQNMIVSHLVIWMFGLTGIGFVFLISRKNIAEQAKAEDVLLGSEEKFRLIFDNSIDGILIADIEDKKFHMANKSICRMLGYSEEEMLSVVVSDIHPKESLSYVVDQFEKQARREIDIAKDIPVRRKDGSIFYADISSAPIELFGRKYLLGLFRDITERKKAEDGIRKLNAELEQRIKYRTKELEAKISEIENMNNLFVGRELRMIELKERIKELEKQIGSSSR